MKAYCSSFIRLCGYFTFIFLFTSYKYTQVSPDRLSQRHNPELYTRADTGLLYKDSISLIMNVSREMESCSSNVGSCEVHLCNIQLPTTSDYDITAGTNRYDMFQDTGYPSSPTTVTSTASCTKGKREREEREGGGRGRGEGRGEGGRETETDM